MGNWTLPKKQNLLSIYQNVMLKMLSDSENKISAKIEESITKYFPQSQFL